MSIRIALSHQTEYRYDRPVSHSPHVIRLRPAPHCRTPIKSYSLKVEPGPHFLNWQQDPFGNYLARLVFPEPMSHLKVTVDVVADLDVINPFDFFVEESAQKFPFTYDGEILRELKPYLEVTESGPLLTGWVTSVDRSPTNCVDFLVDLNRRLQSEIRYLVRMEPGVQTCEETLAQGSGSCRDSGWLLVQILRHLGLAARFASGYLIQLRPDEKPIDGPTGAERDFTDLHAWAEVFIPGAGWIGLDPTSGLLAGEGHVPLACSPDPSSAAPISGRTDLCESQFHHTNEIVRLNDPPRPTKPYSDDDWQQIRQLALRIDQDLAHNDVRLTMGGEPTFVSVDDRDAPEWTVEALGPRKREQAFELIQRLRDRLSVGGVLHFGQGKQYPGEPLPRWRFDCYWRADGVPIWEEPGLVGDERYLIGADLPLAERFIRQLAERLDVDAQCTLPGLEDTVYYLWKEGTIPVNIDPLKTKTDDPMDRHRLRRVLEQGLDRFVGHALPLVWWDGKWRTSRWEFRRERMFLIPGDSPMGYRLPLDALVGVPAGERPLPSIPCPLDFRSPIGDIRREVARRWQKRVAPGSAGNPMDARFTPHISPGQATWLTYTGPGTDIARTALCVEPRDGNLYVFLPPVHRLEHYLELVACIEATAKDLDAPVLIEGYNPPSDPRLRHISIAPDPGVLEVNTPPSADWPSLENITDIVYEEARASRLTTTKFMLDGRQVGTGGGNHVVLGGPTPADSPILRRPDILRSFVTFWQHHPSLTYLFSGIFIGPTSQMPRVDEARDETLYELETAFRLLPQQDWTPSWIVDRLFRHLLVDVTGNTHRTEFCIDKLYSPDGFSGRQGLVELRGLEMPPSPRMSLVQQLLIRSLVAHFWKKPYTHSLVRWGTELHDRFMLPHYLWQDFQDVLHELSGGGYPLAPEWFLPLFEFRFPVYGNTHLDDLEIELRMAIEPWNVLGEEAQASGSARFVDSSIERLQILVRGMTDPRHVLTCNGRRLPLRRTGTKSEFVAGVRYRAWQLPSALHPTVPVHSPLVFDLVDTWLQRSLGGCTYHVFHPGGRSHETMPINEFEAEGRRLSRFWSNSHSSGAIVPPFEQAVGDYPCTLDLLRPPLAT